MTTTETRQQRGLSLYREHASRISEVSPNVYRVPSTPIAGRYYRVNLAEQTCECPDHQHRGERCKHLIAAEIAAKRRCHRQRTRREPRLSRRRHRKASLRTVTTAAGGSLVAPAPRKVSGASWLGEDEG
jgi:hypothetical protein